MKKITRQALLMGGIMLLLLGTLLVLSQESEANFRLYSSYKGNTEVQLCWTKEDSENFHRYEVYRDDVNVDTYNDANVTKHQDLGLTKDTSYDYRVEVYVWNHNHTETYKKDDDKKDDILTGEVEGTVIIDTSWTAGDGPYKLSRAVEVEPGVKLVIGTGTVVNASGTYVEGAHPDIDGITVIGGLSFQDLTSLSVKNSKLYYPEENGAGNPGLEIFNCSNIVIENNEFVDYDPGAWPHGTPAIRFDLQEGEPTCRNVAIYDNEFDACYYGIFGWTLDNATIYDNKFTDNYRGIVIEKDLNNSEIYDNLFETWSWSSGYANGFFVTARNASIYRNNFTDLNNALLLFGKDVVVHNNTMLNVTEAMSMDGDRIVFHYNSMEGKEEYSSGIVFEGDRLTIAHNKLVRFKDNAMEFDRDTSNTTIHKNRVLHGKHGITSSFEYRDHITIRDNLFRNNTGYALDLINLRNSTIRNNQILDSPYGAGIWLHYGCFNNTIRDNTIRNMRETGILLGADSWVYDDNDGNIIEDNHVTGTKYGVKMYGKYDANDGTITADNNTVRNNNLSGNRYGVYIRGGNNNTITDNKIQECEIDGIYISYTDKWDVRYGGHYNKVERNRVSRADSGGWDIMDNRKSWATNEFKENTIGKKYPTTFSISGYNETIRIMSEETPPPMPKPPEHPAKNVNISNFLLVSHEGASFYLTFHYDDDQLRGLKEENMDIWRWQWPEGGPGEPWSKDRNQTVWKGTFPWRDYQENTINVQITNSSREALYALLIPMPVHNTDTDKDFDTVQAAIDDFDTANGHTITVDPAYTEAETEENIYVSKELTIVSTSGGPEANWIVAEDEDKDVIWISEPEVTIKGFTIKGSTSKRGIAVPVDLENILVEDCVFTDNYNGIFYTGYESRADHGTIEIRDCVFDANKNAGVLLNLSVDCKVVDSSFKGGDYGLALQYAKGTSVVGCSFEDQKEMGIYINQGSENSLTGNDVKRGKVGIQVHTSDKNEFSYTTVEDGEKGLELIQADENKIEDTTIKGPKEYGIRLQDCDKNEFLRGHVEGKMTGILFEESEENELTSFLVKAAGAGDVFGVDLKDSKNNELGWVNITDLATIGQQAIGLRFYAGSTHNEVWNCVVRDLESSNSTGVVAGSPLNEFKSVTVSGIITYGPLASKGIWLLPYANANLFADCVVFDVTANYDSFGIYLEENTHNNFTRCKIEKVWATDDEHWGHGVHGDLDTEFELADCEFLNNGVGLFAVNGSAPVVHWSDFTGSKDHGILSMVDSKTLDAENNWWGHKSGPAGVGPGTGDKVSEHVDYEPWVGAEYTGKSQKKVQAGTGVVDTTDDTDAAVDYTTTEELTITTMKYEENPGSGFQGDIGKYIDVHIDEADNADELMIKLYYTEAEVAGKTEAKLRMSWWDGQDWAKCSETGVNTVDGDGYAGYIWAKVRTDTTPSLDDLGGTPFGAGEAEDAVAHEEDDDDDDDGGGGVLLVILVVVVVAALVLLWNMGMLPIGQQQAGAEEPRTLEDKKEEPRPKPGAKAPEEAGSPEVSEGGEAEPKAKPGEMQEGEESPELPGEEQA